MKIRDAPYDETKMRSLESLLLAPTMDVAKEHFPKNAAGDFDVKASKDLFKSYTVVGTCHGRVLDICRHFVVSGLSEHSKYFEQLGGANFEPLGGSRGLRRAHSAISGKTR